MLTWTTYGSWLQGDKRGFVRDGEILQGDERILDLCKKFQRWPVVKLTKQEKAIVEAAILNEAERITHKIEALAICANHIHLAARPSHKSIERLVSMYKSAATRALRCCGRTPRYGQRVLIRGFALPRMIWPKKLHT